MAGARLVDPPVAGVVCVEVVVAAAVVVGAAVVVVVVVVVEVLVVRGVVFVRAAVVSLGGVEGAAATGTTAPLEGEEELPQPADVSVSPSATASGASEKIGLNTLSTVAKGADGHCHNRAMPQPGPGLKRALEWFGLASSEARPPTRHDKARGVVLALVPVVVASVVPGWVGVHGLANFALGVAVMVVAILVWWPVVLWAWPPTGARRTRR